MSDTREAFEAWASRQYSITPVRNGKSYNGNVAEDWGAWQAGRASALPQGWEKMRGGKPVQFWRDDALEQAAVIAERYGADPWAARDIRAMKSAPPLPAAAQQEPKP